MECAVCLVSDCMSCPVVLSMLIRNRLPLVVQDAMDF
jgi:hypothetical protein